MVSTGFWSIERIEMIGATNTEDGVQPLFAVTVATTARASPNSRRSLDFRQLALNVRCGIRLRRTRRRPPVTRTASSRSYTAVEIRSEEEEREIEKQRLKRILKHKDLEALEEFGGVRRAVSFLRSESNPQQQITTNGDLVQSVRGVGFWGSLSLFSKEFGNYLWKSLNSCSILFLIIAADLSFTIGSLEQGVKHGWHDGAGLLVAVFLLVLIPSVVSFYRKRAEEKERLKIKNKLEVTVERDGHCEMVSVSDLKEGEIIHLKEGCRVPADGLLIEGNNLILDEVINWIIDPVRNPFLFSGSVVNDGDGKMIAVSIGANGDSVKGLSDVTDHPSQETLFQSRINKPYKFIEKFSLVVSLMVLFVVLTRLLSGKHGDYHEDNPETKGKLTLHCVEKAVGRIYLKLGQRVSILATVLLTTVIYIQHGMPFAITISLSLWREKMRSLGGKCRNLSTCGTLGLVSTICIDITAEMSLEVDQVCEFFVGKEKIDPGMEFDPDILEGFEKAATVLWPSVHLAKNFLSSWENSGFVMNLESHHRKFEIIDQKFLRSRKGIGALMRRTGDNEANLHLHYNGDASTILNMCSQYYDISGTIHDIENQRERLESVINDMTTKGLRPIAFACKQTKERVFEERRLKLLGLVGLKYSCQKLKMALVDLRNIGVRIILTSEDELSVATAMVDSLGILCGLDNEVVDGKQFREIMEKPEIEKNELMKSITVMAKATSEDKLRLLKVLKVDHGEIVLSLGGLTSRDAPTLREADIGMAQERLCTNVCQMVSDLICEDATSLNRMLRYSRCAYLNIQKFYQVQLTASISGLLITLVFTMASGKSPITTSHLLWVTLIMCLLGSMMMVMELNVEEVKVPIGGRRDQSLITKLILMKIAIHVISQALLFLLLEYLGQKIQPHMKEDVRHTMIFNTFILCQIANLVGAMGLVTNGVAVLKVVLQSFWFLISMVAVLAVQVIVIQFAATLVNGVKLSAVQWPICFIFALTLGWAWNIFFHFFL